MAAPSERGAVMTFGFRHVLYNDKNNNSDMEAKKTKEEKQKDWQDFVAKLKALPPEKLSKAARWVLKEEEKGNEYWMDMKAVLK